MSLWLRIGSLAFIWALPFACATAPRGSGGPGVVAEMVAARPLSSETLPGEARGIVVPEGMRIERVLGRYDLRHEGVLAATFLPGGRQLVSAGAKGDLLVWDAVSRALVRHIPPCPAPPKEATLTNNEATDALAVSADGRLAAQGDRLGNLCVRELASGRVTAQWRAHASPIRTLAFTAAGELWSYGHEAQIVTATNMGDLVLAKEAGGELRRWRLGGAGSPARVADVAVGRAAGLAISPDGARVAAIDDEHLRAWNAAGKLQWDKPARSGRALGFTGGGDRLVVVEARRMRLVDASDGDDDGDLLAAGPLGSDGRWTDLLAVAPDGGQAVTRLDSGGSMLLFFWDLDARREVRRVSQDIYAVRGATHAPDGSALALAARDRVLLWDARRYAPLLDCSSYGAGVRSLGLLGDGRSVITGHDDGTTRLWDVAGPAAGAERARWPASQVVSTAFSPDGRAVLLAEASGARLVDAGTGTARWSVAARSYYAPALLSPDGGRIATIGSAEGLTLHEAATGRPLWSLKEPDPNGRLLAFTPDGRYVVGQDKKGVELWSADDGKHVRRLSERQNLWRIAFSDDGRRAVAAGAGLYVLDVHAGKPLRTLETDWNGPLAITRDGAAVYTGEYDGAIRLRRLDDGKELSRIDLAPSRDRPEALALSPDGSRLFVGTERGVVLVVALRPDAPPVGATPAPVEPPPPPAAAPAPWIPPRW